MIISVPPAMVQQCEDVRRVESRTRSELVREGFRACFESCDPAVVKVPKMNNHGCINRAS